MHIGNVSLEVPLANGRQLSFQRGEIIARPCESHNRFFVLESGKARVFLCEEGRELTLGYLREGSIYVSHSRAWILACTEVEMSSWPLEQLTELLAKKPELTLNAIHAVGTMLHGAINIIEDLAFRPVKSRLARYLLHESELQSSLTLHLEESMEYIASHLGTSRQTLSTELNGFIKSELVERIDRNHILLKKSQELHQIATGLSAS